MLPMILCGGNCLVCCSLVPMLRLNNSRVVQTLVWAQTSVALRVAVRIQGRLCSRMGTGYHFCRGSYFCGGSYFCRGSYLLKITCFMSGQNSSRTLNALSLTIWTANFSAVSPMFRSVAG